MHPSSIGAIPQTLIALLLALTTFPARADLYSAQVAYKKGDFATAFQQFKDLAELGQPEAQADLAVMYARGEGVNASNVYAHAWASLAGQNGNAKGMALAEHLEPNLTPTSLKFSSDIQSKYSQAALNARLMPHFLKGREYEDRDPVHPSKPYIPEYPEDAARRGVQGEVYVEFVVASDGHPRVPRILYAVPGGYFEGAVRESVLRSVYLPARINGQPISTSVSIMYNFTVPGVSIKDYDGLERRVHDTELKAAAGDPQAQMLYGMMIAGLPQLKRTYDQALPWFLRAAQAGAPYAQYQVGTGLLRGRGCQCDSGKGEIWLQKAAQADQSDAQVSLAEYMLKGEPTRESVNGAVVWLERGAKQGNAAAKLLLAGILAATPIREIRDPPRALTLADSLERDYKIDPSFWEIRAAANASRGDYKAAVKAESHAMNEATRLGWDLAPLQQRRSLYESGQPWTGNLLAF
jgi:TonB family protein